MEELDCMLENGVIRRLDTSEASEWCAATLEASLFLVLQRLQDIVAVLNINKCEFFEKSITFVGHKVSEEGIQADEKKAKAMKELPRQPTRQNYDCSSA